HSFGPLGPGTYHVREVLRPGWTQTVGVPTVVAVSGQDVSADIGNFQDFTVSGQVFHDVNGNAIKDPAGAGVAQLGLGGWTVYLDANDNGVFDQGEPSLTTTPGGNFSFPNLGPGASVLRVVLPTGWVQTTPPVIVSGTSGSDLFDQLLGEFQTVTVS